MRVCVRARAHVRRRERGQRCQLVNVQKESVLRLSSFPSPMRTPLICVSLHRSTSCENGLLYAINTWDE
jgi:hypothetical protein